MHLFEEFIFLNELIFFWNQTNDLGVCRAIYDMVGGVVAELLK